MCLTALALGSCWMAALPPRLLRLSQLQFLDLACNMTGDGGAATLESLRQLEWLSLFRCGLTTLPLDVLVLPALEVLDIGGNPIAPGNPPPQFPGATNLCELRVYKGSLAPATLASFPALTQANLTETLDEAGSPLWEELWPV